VITVYTILAVVQCFKIAANEKNIKNDYVYHFKVVLVIQLF